MSNLVLKKNKQSKLLITRPNQSGLNLKSQLRIILSLSLVFSNIAGLDVASGKNRFSDLVQAANPQTTTAYPLYAWGYNRFGQLGNGSTNDFNANPTPIKVTLPPGVIPTALAGGEGHSLAIGSDSKLYAWGYNAQGELGNGTTDNSAIPIEVNLPANITPTAIAGGALHSLAIGNDGNIYSWGGNNYGQLGNGTTGNISITPVIAHLPAGVTPLAIAAGQFHNIAIGSNGNLYAWGANGAGELGNGTTTDSSIPITVNLPVGVTPTAIATTANHNLAIGNDGNLYAWGTNYFGQLGNGTSSESITTPVRVNLPAGVIPTVIAAGQYHSMAIGSDNKLYAWGDNSYGQLGNGTGSNNSTNPIVVSLPAGVIPTAIASSGDFSLAAGNDGKFYAWGKNQYGELGDGTTIARSVPVAIGLTGNVPRSLLAAGYDHGMAALEVPSIRVYSGSGQNSQVHTDFSSPLVISVSDEYNNPISGISVTFTAPGNGASGMFANGSSVYTGTTGPDGILTSTTFTANTVAGNYNVTAKVQWGTTATTFTLTNLAGPPSQISAVSGGGQSTVVSTTFAQPLVARVADSGNNPVSGAVVTFTAPGGGTSGGFVGGSAVYTGATDVSGLVTSTAFTANSVTGVYTVTATVGGVNGAASFSLTNLVACDPLLVTSKLDDGSCGTLRQALVAASTSQTKTVTINLAAGSVISLTTGLTLTSNVVVTTTAPCGTGPNNTMLPPVILQGAGPASGNGLTLAGNNRLYGLWVRGFSGVQIKAPAGSSTRMQCVKVSKN